MLAEGRVGHNAVLATDCAGFQTEQILLTHAEDLSRQLKISPDSIHRGAYALSELDEYFEGGLPPDVKNVLFGHHLQSQDVPLERITPIIYGERYSRDQFAELSHGLAELDRGLDARVMAARNMFAHMTDTPIATITEEQIDILAEAENSLCNGVSISEVQSWLDRRRSIPQGVDAHVIRSKLAVNAMMSPNPDVVLANLSALGYSDEEILHRLALATDSFQTTQHSDLGTYAFQIYAALHLSAPDEELRSRADATGLSDDDVLALSEYIEHVGHSTAKDVSQKLAELAKQGVPHSEWYRHLSGLMHVTSKFMQHPIFKHKFDELIFDLVRQGTAVLDIQSQLGLPGKVVTSYTNGQKPRREKLFEDIITTAQKTDEPVVELLRRLINERFTYTTIFADERVYESMKALVKIRLAEGRTWPEIRSETWIPKKQLAQIVGELIESGDRKSHLDGHNYMSADEQIVLRGQVLEIMHSGERNPSTIAAALGVAPWRVEYLRTELIAEGLLENMHGAGRRKKRDMIASFDGTPQQDSLLTEQLGSISYDFVRRNRDLFISLGDGAVIGGYRYRANMPAFVAVLKQSHIPHRTFERELTQNGRKSIQRLFFVIPQLQPRLADFLDNSPELAPFRTEKRDDQA